MLLLAQLSEAVAAFLCISVLLLLIAGVIGAVVAYNWWVAKQYRELAEHFHGRSGDFSPLGTKEAFAVFRHMNHHVVVRPISARTGQESSVECQINWPDPEFFCRIEPRSLLSKVWDWFNKPERTGDPSFHRRYVVRCEDQKRAERIVSPKVQSLILELARDSEALSFQYSTPKKIKVEWIDGSFKVSIQGIHQKSAHLIDFAQRCLRIFQESLPRSADILFVTRAPSQVNDINCQVCGEAIESEMVWCEKCETPHHKSCWDYNGKCSTYACGAVKYRGAQRAQSMCN